MAQRTAHSIGATNASGFKDGPNNHDLHFASETGTTLRFGSQASALLTAPWRSAARSGDTDPQRHRRMLTGVLSYDRLNQ
ncbi:hypothetical protein HZU40_22425 [Mycolicibacterium fluoranthenivorans]|uniref:Uncharacterized protein n=1 Tax=Mycolicibacterium fluoranthenivorans TaxID=258505 RepID=A0A7G8PPK9_9MYCO|nr:hypothetical protein HZU40_22425 [Mycolicibacterium fluoranthenivorans]